MEHHPPTSPFAKHDANELLRAAAERNALGSLPYFCECDDPACLAPVWLDTEGYDLLRGADEPLLAPVHAREPAAH